MKSDKRLSAASMHIALSRDHGITISSGRVYRTNEVYAFT